MPTIAPKKGAAASAASQRSACLPVALLAQHERDRVQPVGEVVADHGDEDEHAGQGVDAEREADPEPVDEAVHRERGRAERADAMVRPGLVRVVAVVQHERALEEEEREEAGRDERRHACASCRSRRSPRAGRRRARPRRRRRRSAPARSRGGRRSRSAVRPPISVETTVRSESGIAIQLTRTSRRRRTGRPRGAGRRSRGACGLRSPAAPRRARSPRPRRTRRRRGDGDGRARRR